MGDHMRTAIVVSLFLLLSVLYERASGTRRPLHFSLVVSFGRDGFNSSGSIPAIDLALDQINARQTVLPGYELRYTPPRDSECNRGSSLGAFFGDVQSEPVKIALLGCGCSVATEPVAEISHRWNISQISFASAVSSLSDRTRFRKYFRTFPTFENVAPALLAVLEHYKWKRIAFLTQNENLFNKLYSDFQKLVEMVDANTTKVCCFNATNITVVSSSFQTNQDPVPHIKDLFEEHSGYRILFVNSYSAIARRVICEAARRNLTSPRYTWILYGWYPERWWTAKVANNTVNCTDQQLESFLEKSRPLVIQQYPAPDDINTTAIGEITRLEFDELYKNKADEQRHTTTVVGSLAYDGVWALALALNRTMGMIERRDISETGCEEKGLEGALVPLHDFDYTNGLMGCVIRWSLEQTNFSGASGRIQFDVNGTIIQNRIRLLQYRRSVNGDIRRLKIVRYGFIDRSLNFELQYEEMESDLSVFPAGIPPDGTPVKIIHTFHPGLVATYYTLATLGLCFAIGCLVFNTAFYKRKVVQMTSPNLNYFIAVGALLLYTSVYVGVLHTTDETAVKVHCILFSWLYVVGYLLAFGTVLAKMWRIYHIFHNPSLTKKPLRDWHLAVILLILTGIGVLLMVIRTSTQFATESPFLVPDKENSEGRTEHGTREDYFVWQCYESVSGPFYSDLLVFAYFGLLQIVVILLALQTRKVKVTGLNDSKFVAVLVFISSVVLVIFILVTFSLRGYINITAALINGGILVWATTFLVLMFVPKMVNLYRDPKGEKMFQRTNIPTNGSKTVQVVLSNGGDEQLVAVLERKIQEQKLLIQQKDKRIRELEKTEPAGS